MVELHGGSVLSIFSVFYCSLVSRKSWNGHLQYFSTWVILSYFCTLLLLVVITFYLLFEMWAWTWLRQRAEWIIWLSIPVTDMPLRFDQEGTAPRKSVHTWSGHSGSQFPILSSKQVHQWERWTMFLHEESNNFCQLNNSHTIVELFKGLSLCAAEEVYMFTVNFDMLTVNKILCIFFDEFSANGETRCVQTGETHGVTLTLFTRKETTQWIVFYAKCARWHKWFWICFSYNMFIKFLLIQQLSNFMFFFFFLRESRVTSSKLKSVEIMFTNICCLPWPGKSNVTCKYHMPFAL